MEQNRLWYTIGICPPPLAADSRPIDSDPIWTMHVLYFWKALVTRTPKKMLPAHGYVIVWYGIVWYAIVWYGCLL